MPKNNFVTELVDAFNLRNYYFDDVNTNFTVKGNKIVGLFASDVEVKKYFHEVRKEIIKRHYGTEEVAGEYYNLNYFPFVFDVNSKWKAKERAIREVKLGDSTNNEVIRNLKIYFAKEFQRAVEVEIIKNLETSARMMKEKACECLEGSVLEEIDRHSPYLYCISFNDRYCKENRYPPRFFEAFRGMYISAFDLKLEEYGFDDSSIFYEQRDNKLYIKDITNINVVKNVAKHVRGRIALDFKTPGSVESKVENCKNVLNDLIFKSTGKSIYGYDYDDFTSEDKIKNGHSFALIPFIEENGQLKSLSFNDAGNIDEMFNKGILNGFYPINFISDIKGKTANPQFANCKGPIYAFSNKQIALLLPKIMESPIAYNQINGHFEFAVDLENFKRRGSSRSSSTVTSPFNSPTHAGPSGLRTPPNQRKKDTDSGYDSNSPPKPKDSVAHSSSGGPGPSTELSDMEWESPTRSPDGALEGPPRPELEESFMLHKTLDVPGTSGGPLTRLGYSTVSRGVAGPSSSSQSVGAAQNRWLPQDTSENKWIPQVQFAEPGPGDLSCTQSSSEPSPRPSPAFPVHSTTNDSISRPLSQGTTVVESSSGLNLQEPLTNGEKKELYEILCPEMKKKLDSKSFFPGYERLLYLLYVDKRELRLLLSSPREVEQVCSILPLKEREQLHQDLPSEAKKGLLFKFFDEQEISGNASTSFEDSGIFSGFPASPAVSHKESVSSKVEECSAQHMLEALKK